MTYGLDISVIFKNAIPYIDSINTYAVRSQDDKARENHHIVLNCDHEQY